MEPVDHRANAIGRVQRGYVTRRQLVEVASISRATVLRRLASGQWTEPVRGIIDLGTHAPSLLRDLQRALLVVGPASWLSHATAAHLHGFLDVQAPQAPDIVVRRGRSSDVVGVRLHTTRKLADDETTQVRGLRCTSRARTLLDLAPGRTVDDLERLAADLGRRDRRALRQLGVLVDRYPAAPGRRRLVTALARLPGDVGRLGSPLEVLGVATMRRVGAPPPVLQYQVRDAGGAPIKRVDAAWPDARTVLEFDGAAYHDTTRAAEHDREVRARMRALGWTVEVLRRSDLDGPAPAAIAERLRDSLSS